jgi:hypothetical protein
MYAETEKWSTESRNSSMLNALVKDILEGKTFRKEFCPGLFFSKTLTKVGSMPSEQVLK